MTDSTPNDRRREVIDLTLQIQDKDKAISALRNELQAQGEGLRQIAAALADRPECLKMDDGPVLEPRDCGKGLVRIPLGTVSDLFNLSALTEKLRDLKRLMKEREALQQNLSQAEAN